MVKQDQNTTLEIQAPAEQIPSNPEDLKVIKELMSQLKQKTEAGNAIQRIVEVGGKFYHMQYDEVQFEGKNLKHEDLVANEVLCQLLIDGKTEVLIPVK
ncbi:hypothetical protein GOQ04_03285 [Emticicia sp. ODNR4P]|nr:hypothetical protein [Emticicia sp. ODNR4P]